MILAFDTSTPACTVALFAADGHLFASRDEVIGRGHAERLWKRPFGKLYMDLGLKLTACGEAPSPAFDRCHWWLLSK